MRGSRIFLILILATFSYTLLISGPGCATDMFNLASICQHKLHGASCPNLLSIFAFGFFAPLIGLMALSIWPLVGAPSFRVLKPPR